MLPEMTEDMHLSTMNASDLLDMQDRDAGIVTVTGDSGHDVVIQAQTLHDAAPDYPKSIWVATCTTCGTLGVWQHALHAIRHAQDH